jgi:alpha-ketoglutarate-dependent taurine dioxygenase
MKAKPDQLIVTITVAVSDREYGSNIAYQSTRYNIDKEHPTVPREPAAQDITSMISAAFSTSVVEAAYDAVLAEDEDDA